MRNVATERVLILGTDPLAGKVAEVISAFPYRYGIVGFVDDAFNTGGVLPRNGAAIFRNGDTVPHTMPLSETLAGGGGFELSNPWDQPGNGAGAYFAVPPFPIIGPLDRLENAIRDLRPDRIIVPFAEGARLPLQALLNSRIDGVVVEDANELYERLTRKLAIESLPPSLLILCKSLKRPRLQMALRRALSVTFAGFGLLLAAPFVPLIALAIKLDSKGPVFFVHQRIGILGRPFRLYKFRTMYPTDGTPSEWARDNDYRVTRVGMWLRRFRLDELPQLINVLRGDMEMVGPRPHPVSNMDLFAEKIPYYPFRSVVRPGITGWAQVRYGYANNVDEEIEKMRYDLYYIKNLSVLFDLRILVRTIQIILFGRGANGIEPVHK